MFGMVNKSRTLHFGIVFVLGTVMIGGAPYAVSAGPASKSGHEDPVASLNLESAGSLNTTLIVTNTNNSGTGSLRQAVSDAASGDTILFASSLAGQTIALTSAINLDKDLTIDASSLDPTVELSGNLVSRIFNISSNSTVTLLSLLLKDGRSVSASGGAIYSEGNLTVNNSTFINNAAADNGGAIFSTFSTYVNDSTFVNNSAQSGGAIYLPGGIFSNPESHRTIVNSTFVSNQADTANGQGGGVFNYGGGDINGSGSDFVLSNNTFSGNGAYAGGNLYNWGGMSFNNNIFANNTSGGDCYSMGSIYPIIVYGVNNLIEDGVPCSQGTFIGGDPLLGSLADNGGPTMTMALLPGSPAIDAGTATCVSTDQRGVTRPQGAACEIGAYEYEYQTVIYHVKWDASGANNGTSWTDAYTDLQSALAAASTGDQIWVAAGAYQPTAGADRTISFALKNGVAMYGGFAGIETLLSQRNYETHITILSGDIGVVGDNSDNSYHVVIGSNTNNYAKLDGFTVTAGNADDSAPRDAGGGMFNDVGNPSLTNVIFSDNYARFGGGMYNGGEYSYPNGSNPVLTNVTFRNNSAIEGGGVRNENYSSPRLLDVTFSGNSAVRSGGGMENFHYSAPIMTNVTFDANTSFAGAGMMNWDNSSPILTNVTFNANSATDWGGAIYNDNGSNPWLSHVTLHDNEAPEGGGLYNAYGSNPGITSSILYGNPGGEIFDESGTSSVTYSIVQGGYPGTGNLDLDPLLGPLQDNGGFTQTMALGAGSPAIDAGGQFDCPATDQRGVARPQGSQCDMGAYEHGSSVVTKTADTDDGICNVADCSLREAIEVAPGGGTITFAPALSGQTITLGSTLVVNKSLTIDGSALASKVSVSGNNAATVFQIAIGATVNLDSLIVTNGRATEYDGSLIGGGIRNFGNLAITNSTITNNLAQDGGGGVSNLGPAVLNILNSTVSNNTGGIGGGIYNLGELLQVTNSTISGNTAIEGGGIYNVGTTNLINSTVSGNSARGGGIISTGILNITNSTFAGNSSSAEGGGILNYGPLTVVNGTFSGNSAATIGGGIYNGNGPLNLINTILANSTSGGDCYNDTDLAGVIGDNINNLVETNAAAPNGCGIPASSADPKLGPLANNGGFTQTFALLSDSPAIHAGNDTHCPATDQRGVTRPQGSQCDIGAYEFEGPIPTPTFTPTSGVPTSTRTPTKTPKGASPTPTITLTSTPITPTATHTLTPHPPTVTFTPSPTITATNTGTAVPPTTPRTPTNTPKGPRTNTPTVVGPSSTPTFTPLPTFTATNTPVFTPTNTAVPPTATFTATPTHTATTSPSIFPTTNVLDTFNRANGAPGKNWGGATSGYSIVSNRLAVGTGDTLLWKVTQFGTSQEVFVPLTTVDTSASEHTLLLKSQSPTTWQNGVIAVAYAPLGHVVQVWTYSSAQGWVQYGTDIPVTMVNGDQFGARAKSDGTVEVYRNGILIGSRDVSGWTYSANGGYIGLQFVNSGDAILDDFGGGTVIP